MAADVVGGYIQETSTGLVGNRCKWLRGKWATDRHKASSSSFDGRGHQSRKGSESSSSSSRIKQPHSFEQRRHRSEPEANISGRSSSPINLHDGSSVVSAGDVANGPAKESEVTVGPKTAVIVSDRKSKFGRCGLRPFKRAFSYETREAEDVTIVDIKTRTRAGHTEDLEMTYVEMQQTMEILGPMDNGSDGLGNQLKTFHRDNGIVCSDEDLRSILSSKIASESSSRVSADIRREKMKSNRSLSLDSSFFKLRIKRLQADSPNWLSKIISQRERNVVKEAVNVGGNGSSVDFSVKCDDYVDAAVATTAAVSDAPSTADASPRLSLVEHRRSNFAATEKPSTITEDSSSVEGDLSSRRESNVSGGGTSDDESSLLLNRNGPTQNDPEEYANPCSVDKQVGPTQVASKVLWNEESEVDAEVLGHAIEFYLTSTIKTSSTNNTSANGGHAHCKGTRNSVPDTIAPVVSTLKGLFVK